MGRPSSSRPTIRHRLKGSATAYCACPRVGLRVPSIRFRKYSDVFSTLTSPVCSVLKGRTLNSHGFSETVSKLSKKRESWHDVAEETFDNPHPNSLLKGEGLDWEPITVPSPSGRGQGEGRQRGTIAVASVVLRQFLKPVAIVGQPLRG